MERDKRFIELKNVILNKDYIIGVRQEIGENYSYYKLIVRTTDEVYTINFEKNCNEFYDAIKQLKYML